MSLLRGTQAMLPCESGRKSGSFDSTVKTGTILRLQTNPRRQRGHTFPSLTPRVGVATPLRESDLAQFPRAAPEAIEFDAQLLKHAHVQVRQRFIVLAIVRHVSSVLESTTREHNRQVVAGVGRAVTDVAAVEDNRLIEQRNAALVG